jgi:hypothetical protein
MWEADICRDVTSWAGFWQGTAAGLLHRGATQASIMAASGTRRWLHTTINRDKPIFVDILGHLSRVPG